jgi:hypothetical protein
MSQPLLCNRLLLCGWRRSSAVHAVQARGQPLWRRRQVHAGHGRGLPHDPPHDLPAQLRALLRVHGLAVRLAGVARRVRCGAGGAAAAQRHARPRGVGPGVLGSSLSYVTRRGRRDAARARARRGPTSPPCASAGGTAPVDRIWPAVERMHAGWDSAHGFSPSPGCERRLCWAGLTPRGVRVRHTSRSVNSMLHSCENLELYCSCMHGRRQPACGM